MKGILYFILFLFFFFYSGNYWFLIGKAKISYIVLFILMYFFIVYFIMNRFVSKKFFLFIKSEKWFFLFTTICIITTPLNAIIFDYYKDINVYLINLLQLLSFFILYLIVRILKIDFLTFIKFIFFSYSPFIILFGIKIFEMSRDGLVFRFTGSYSDPNAFCGALLLYISAIVILLFRERNKLIKVIYALLLLIAFFSYILTISRGGLIAIITYTFVLLFLLGKKKEYGKVRAILIFTILAIVITVIAFPSSTSWFIERFNPNNQAEMQDALLKIREAKAGISLIEQKPYVLIFGSGFGSTGTSFFSKYFFESNPHRIHITPLAVLVEDGIIGFILFLMIIIISLKRVLIGMHYDISGVVLLSLIIGQFVLSLSVWLMYFFPFWVSLYFLPGLFYINSFRKRGEVANESFNFSKLPKSL